VLLTQLPGLKEALVEPLHPEVAVHEPEMALSCLALLEAGVRWVQHRLAGCLMVGVGCGRRGGGGGVAQRALFKPLNPKAAFV
jgi:hypothetical protein